jgi:hypothetical protein
MLVLMSLTSLWLNSAEQLTDKHVQAMVGLAGDGRLQDAGNASFEFRGFLTHVSSELLERYAAECLGNEKFAEAPRVLQDVINEVGRRAGFDVEPGLYRGRPNQIGFDGIWRSDDAHAIVLEVKTTDTYTIDLDTLAVYRRRLIAEARIDSDNSSILIVVGRSDTAAWEAQIRGSRHAWDVRLISVNALLRLMNIRKDLEDPVVIRKIRDILTPKEFTKVDEIIELVFSTTEEVKVDEEIVTGGSGTTDTEKSKAAPVDFREAGMSRIVNHTGVPLVKRSPAVYSSPDNTSAVCCLISKEYAEKSGRYYWFGFRRSQCEALQKYSKASVAFCCGSENEIALVPVDEMKGWLDFLNVTDRGRAFYWHVHLRHDRSRWLLETRGQHDDVDISKYLI